MADAQTKFGPDDAAVRSLGSAAFGRNLFKLLPEDDHDRQPLIDAAGRYIFVADVRLDNRVDIARLLGREVRALDSSCDADLLFSAWIAWSDSGLGQLRGDYAFAVWDQLERALTLVRGPLSSRPIFFHEGGSFIAFASTPTTLAALPAMPWALNFDRAAAFIMRATGDPGSSFFQELAEVEPGSVVSWQGGQKRDSHFWRLEPGSLDRRNEAEAAESFRELLQHAVAVRLRRHHGSVAAQLSSGRDSSAVTATAALLLAQENERLCALTGAPSSRFTGASPAGYFPDESALAAKTAGLYPNVDHRVCRPEDASFKGVDEMHRLGAAPLGHITNQPWLDRIGRQAGRAGSTVLLTGEGGNFTISAGGNAFFGQYLRENGLGAAWRLARNLHREELATWRALLSIGAGPHVPARLYDLALWIRRGAENAAAPLRLLRQPYREVARARLEAEFPDSRPPRDYQSFRRHMLLRRNVTNKTQLAAWGLDQRDPTIDRDLVEFCFSLPSEMLISGSSQRPLFELAMQSRLPPEVIRQESRGYQGADWYLLFTRDAVRQEFARHSGHELVRELLDVDYLDSLIDRWPTSGWERWPVFTLYRNHVLAAVSLANFISAHFPNA